MRKILLLLVIVSLLAFFAYAEMLPIIDGLDRAMSIRTEDGSVSIDDVLWLKVTSGSLTDNEDGTVSLSTTGNGSAIIFDIGDDGGNDSTDVNEIATTGDTNNIFTEPTADKILIAVGNNWPTADAVTNATLTTALTVNTGTVGLIGNVANTSILTLGAGASSVSGSNTGDNSGTDDQTIDVFSISGNNVQLSLESDGEATKTADISTTTAVVANTAKNTNVPTALSLGTVGATTIGITSDGGADDVTLPAATTDDAGLLTAALFDEIDVNTAKVTDDDIGVAEVYDATGWNADTSSPQKNDVRDKIVSMDSAISSNTSKTTESTTVTSPLVLSTYDISIPAATNAAAGHASAAHITAIEANTTHASDNTQAHSDYMLNSGDIASGTYDFGGATLEIPNSISLPGTCTVGQEYMDTDATSGQRFYLCESTDNWVLQGGGGVGDVTAASTIADHTIVRGDGGAKGIQESGISIDDSDNMTLPTGADLKAETTINTPEVDQNITAVTDTLSSSATHIQLNPNADYIMTSTPTIAAGVEGQLLIFENISAYDIDLQDDSVLAGSDVFLGRAEGTVAGGGVAYLFYSDDSGGGWRMLSNPNTAALGADATLMEARNETGSTIVAGKPVFISGYNVGQGRPLIALADADDSSKMPAIGVVVLAIATGKNGDVITSGSAVNIIDTSGQAINAPVYIGTTAGELVYTRPTGATTAIQRIGTVARANLNNGVVIITGAGRQNDQENVTEAYIFVGNANEKPVAVAMGGDVAIIANGTTTVAGTHSGSAHHSELTQEQVDDYVNLLIKDADSVHTRITITYDDVDNAFDFVVDDMNGTYLKDLTTGVGLTGGADNVLVGSDTDVELSLSHLGIENLSDPAANRIWIWDDTDNAVKHAVIGSGLTYTAATDTLTAAVGGSAIVFDIGDDGGNDSTNVNEIATTGDTNNIFTEPTADKILIAVGNNWPTADAVTNATLTTALTVNTGTLTLIAAGTNDSVLTIGAGAVSVSGSNTGDNSGTDDQTIDVFSISGNNVQLSLEDDGEATKTVDISSTTAVAANTTHAADSTQAHSDYFLNTGTDIAGAGAGFTWTFNASAGVDSIFTFGDGTVDLTTGALKVGGSTVITATLTEEEVEDYVGTMVDGGTETRIAVTYTDGGVGAGVLNFVVDDMNDVAVTLAADANVLLGLSTQELNLDSQNANVIFSGPASGGAADPTFRSLVDNDVLDNITVNSSNVITSAVGFDAIGAVDMDYGSGDVTDHTFLTDGTGDSEIVLPNDSIGAAELVDDLVFATFPSTPSSVPDADYEVANKKYVDDTASQLTQEQVDDYVNLLIKDADSVHTRITITYDDTDNAFDFVVDAELDPVVGAVTGIVKSDGSANFSAASAGTDYQAPITGTDTHVMFFDGANTPAGEAGLTYNKATDILSVTGKVYQSGLGGSTFLGYEAGKNDDLTDNYNTGVGYQALYTNTTGYYNAAMGYGVLVNNLDGFQNTGVGLQALFSNTSGSNNTGVGFQALNYNLESYNNVAVGAFAGNTDDEAANVTGASGCVIIGASADFDTTTPNNEIVIGATANGSGDNSVTLGNDNITKTILKGKVGIGTIDPGTLLELSDNNGNTNRTLLTILNDDDQATGETAQTSDIEFEFRGTIDEGSNYTDEKAAKISAYKISDYWHASNQTDNDAGLKFYTVTDGSYVLNFTLSGNDLTVAGDIAGANLSGTNTGDDDQPEAGDYAANSIDDDDILNSADVMSGSFGITIDGGGSAITTGVKGYIEIPYAMTIDTVTMLADQSGSAVVDIWIDSYANYPPTNADTITSSAVPTISGATKSQDTTLTGWTTSVTAGDVVGFNVDSANTITRLHIIVSGNKL